MQTFKQSKHTKFLTIVEMPNKKFIIVFGKYKVSNKDFEKVEEAEKYIGTKPWDLIINIMNVIAEYEKENQNPN